MILCSLQFRKGVLNGSLETWLIPKSWLLTLGARKGNLNSQGSLTWEGKRVGELKHERWWRAFPRTSKVPKSFFKNNYLSSVGQVLNTQTRLQFFFTRAFITTNTTIVRVKERWSPETRLANFIAWSPIKFWAQEIPTKKKSVSLR